MNKRILLVDDDVTLVDILKTFLTKEGFDIDFCHDGETAITLVNRHDYDVILLDIMLPSISGLHVLQVLKPDTQTPIIMLTAKGDVEDEIIGLDTGAFDYISKPFDLRILKARIIAAINHSMQQVQSIVVDDITFESLELKTSIRKAYLNENELELTKSEYQILLMLIKNISIAVSKEDLFQTYNKVPYPENDRSVDTHIKNLRRKIKQLDASRNFDVKSIYGFGYMLEYHEQ